MLEIRNTISPLLSFLDITSFLESETSVVLDQRNTYGDVEQAERGEHMGSEYSSQNDPWVSTARMLNGTVPHQRAASRSMTLNDQPRNVVLLFQNKDLFGDLLSSSPSQDALTIVVKLPQDLFPVDGMFCISPHFVDMML